MNRSLYAMRISPTLQRSVSVMVISMRQKTCGVRPANSRCNRKIATGLPFVPECVNPAVVFWLLAPHA